MILLSVLAALMLFAAASGSSGITVSQVLETVLGRGTTQTEAIVFRVRLPRVMTAVAVGAALAISGCIMQNVLHNPLASASTLGVSQGAAFGAALAIIALDAATAIPFARLRQQGRAKRFVALRLLSVAVNLALTVFFYSALPALASRGADAGMYDPAFGAGYVLVANLLGSAVVWVGLYPSCHGARPRIRPKLLRAVMLYSLPLLISGIAGTANEFIDRQMIKYLLPPESSMDALGIYGAVAKLGVVLMLFTQMYRYAAEPYFLSAFRQEDFRRSNAEALKYFIIVSVGIFLTIMLFVDLFGLLMGRDFRQGIRVLPIILLANMFSGIWLTLSFWYKQSGQTQYAIWITGTGLVFTVGLNLALTPALGYPGAALARLGCETAMVVVSYYLNRKHCPTPYDLPRIGSYFLAGGAIYALSLLTVRLSPAAHYAANLLLLAAFGWLAVHRERIDLKGLLRSIVKH